MKLKELREFANLTQRELAEKAGVSTSAIGMIENGTNMPSVPLAKKLGEIFNIEWKIFFE